MSPFHDADVEQEGSDASVSTRTRSKLPKTNSNRGHSDGNGRLQRAPGAPKMARTPFILFSAWKHRQIREELRGTRGERERMVNVAKMVAGAWRKLSPEERRDWEEKAELDKVRFLKEKLSYKGPWRVAARAHVPPKSDPTAPKRPLPAFLVYSNKKRAEIKKQNPKADNGAISRILAEQWRNEPQALRKRYVHEAAEKRKKYKAEVAAWRARPETQHHRMAAPEAASSIDEGRNEDAGGIPLEAETFLQHRRNAPSSSANTGPDVCGRNFVLRRQQESGTVNIKSSRGTSSLVAALPEGRRIAVRKSPPQHLNNFADWAMHPHSASRAFATATSAKTHSTMLQSVDVKHSKHNATNEESQDLANCEWIPEEKLGLTQGQFGPTMEQQEQSVQNLRQFQPTPLTQHLLVEEETSSMSSEHLDRFLDDDFSDCSSLMNFND